MTIEQTQRAFDGATKPALVAICVVTSGRPKMLSRCLASIIGQQIDRREIYPRIIVVSNGPNQDQTEDVVAHFQARSQFPFHFVHDDIRGIARARNRACAIALGRGAEWIAFIDDDEIADVDWLMQLMAPEWRGYPVLMGANVYSYPSPAPFWAVEKPLDTSDEALACKTASAGNVRFSVDLLRAFLVFDERLAFSGGEDNDFFSRAHAMGFQIRQTYSAITREPVHKERLGYFAQMYRAYWCASSDLRRLGIEKGSAWRAALRKAPTVPANAIAGVALLIACPVAAMIGGRLAFKKFALRGGKKLAKAAGRFAAIVGHMPQPYTRIHGE